MEEIALNGYVRRRQERAEVAEKRSRVLSRQKIHAGYGNFKVCIRKTGSTPRGR
jgi:hypothetical protein